MGERQWSRVQTAILDYWDGGGIGKNPYPRGGWMLWRGEGHATHLLSFDPSVVEAGGMTPGERLILRACRDREMTAGEKEAQRRSFAYGNAHLSNPAVTREMVDAAADALTSDTKGGSEHDPR